MPTWGGILRELNEELSVSGPSAVDIIRRKYLALTKEETGRNIILYAS